MDHFCYLHTRQEIEQLREVRGSKRPSVHLKIPRETWKDRRYVPKTAHWVPALGSQEAGGVAIGIASVCHVVEHFRVRVLPKNVRC